MTDSNMNIIIARFFSHEATEEEALQLLDWLKASDGNNRYFREQQEIWHRLHPAYTIDEIDVDKAEEKISYRTGIRHRGIYGFLKRFVNVWSRVAAVMLLPLIAGIVYLLINHNGNDSEMMTLSTAYGCNSHFTLPDGSEVWLNSNSTLKYIPDASSCRNVYLAGEAYFSVHSDSGNPFIVKTSGLQVTSTGTQFNVNAYDSTQSVTLVEGKVSVSASDEQWTMNPGEHLALADSGVVVTSDVDIEKYCSWRDGMLIFNDEPLSFICSRLEQLLNVDIELDPSLAGKKFHIILNGEDIHEFIYLLELSGEVECEMLEKMPESDGQQKIEIRKKI